MSAVHSEIALTALRSLDAKSASLFSAWTEEIAKAATYPDVFADSSMPRAKMLAIDPDAPELIYPPHPEPALAKRIDALSELEASRGVSPLRCAYLAEHYLEKALAAFAAGEGRVAAKLCAVYSHVIGDVFEPIHAVSPEIVDLVLPPPAKFQGLELHSCLEQLRAPVHAPSRKPKLLGSDAKRAAMAAYAALVKGRDLGASLAVPMAAAMYKGRKAEAKKLSSLAQSAAAMAFADFLFTVASLHFGRVAKPASLDLRLYPVARAEMDMLYRYRPSLDRSLVPYAGGKSLPMRFAGEGVSKVKGIGMIPSLAPPFCDSHERSGSAEYYLVPGAFKTFSARVGLNALFSEALTPLSFVVFADGVEVARSRSLRESDGAEPLSASIDGARWLRLSIVCDKNPTPEEAARLHCRWASHAIWADPLLK